MSDDLLTIIDNLLDYAMPGGMVHARLVKYRRQVVGNVMLGPSIRRYLEHLVQLANDSVECRNLTAFGKCKIKARACNYLDKNNECPSYEESKPQRKRS